jgi:hypothetical protein
MAPAHDFKLALTRVIEPTGGPGAELATLEDAARFIGLMSPWRQAWYAAELVLIAATTGDEADIERDDAPRWTPHKLASGCYFVSVNLMEMSYV